MTPGIMSESNDLTEPVSREQLVESPRPPRLAAATLPPPLPPAVRRVAAPARALLTVTSDPPKATVVVVMSGRAQVAGLTPVRIDVDPRLYHDVIIGADGYDTVVWRLPPQAPLTINATLLLRVE